MIELIDGLPDNVIGARAVGKVHSSDYETVLDPAAKAAAAANDKIRFLYVLGDDFDGYSAGAMWQDTKIGIDYWSKWERIAVVTDHDAYEDGIKLFGWMVPGEIKVFENDDLDDAKEWVSE